ncbi:MAG TPA: hypothetical protein VD995_15880 [Azospirillum sp.]|nr:hypothetical protein [Azospirillum sp.]
MELILFERDGSLFALPADAVAQVAVDCPLKPLPFPCAPVEGFVQVGERALVAIDLTARLRPGPDPTLNLWSPMPETLEVRSAAGPFAVRVRRVLGRVPMDCVPLDALTFGADPQDVPNAAGEPVIASFDWHDRRVLLLDPEALRVVDPVRQRPLCDRRPPPDAPAAVEAPRLPASPPAARFRQPDVSPD